MLSIPHLIVIFIVALVVFGPEKLPELARNLGKVMAEFRRATGDLRSTVEGHLRDIEREADARRIAPPAAVASATAGSVATSASPPGTVPSSPPNASAIALEGPSIAEVRPENPDSNGHNGNSAPEVTAGSDSPTVLPAQNEPSESEHLTT